MIARMAGSRMAALGGLAAAGVLGGFALGRSEWLGWIRQSSPAEALPHGTLSAGTPSTGTPSTPVLRRQAWAELAEIRLPRLSGGSNVSESNMTSMWRGAAAEVLRILKYAGVPVDLADAASTARLRDGLEDATEVAAVFDLVAELLLRGGDDSSAGVSSAGALSADAATRVAATLDPDPERTQLRGALLADDPASVRTFRADHDSFQLSATTATLQ